MRVESSTVRGLVRWIAILSLVSVALWVFRDQLEEVHETLVFLMVVLIASARHGRLVGFALSALAFLAFDFLLLPPLYTLRLEDSRDWLVLAAFLVTGAVTAELFHRARRAQVMAEDRAREAERLAALADENRTRLDEEAERVAGLREAHRLKDAFIASVSHDLRTPLTTIRALAAEMREADGERAVIIEEEAERLNRMVTDLLDLSRVRAGGLQLDLQVIAAEDLVGATLQRMSGAPGADQVIVRLPADGTLPVARMDFVQALRALGNLLENALRHGSGHPVELDVRVEGLNLIFRVLDRGPGIAEGERERIFDAFYAKRSSGDSAAGAGLGLAIARSLAEAQGGALRYEPREGGGSTFVLTFPAESISDLE